MAVVMVVPRRLVAVVWYILLCCWIVSGVGPWVSGLSISHKEQQLLRRASALSQAAPQNITAAHEACAAWKELLCDKDNDHDDNDHDDKTTSTSTWPPTVEILACTLYAHCLVRVGNDPWAVDMLDRAATTCATTSSTLAEIYLTKGLCYQRMMQYENAVQCLEQVLSITTTSNEGDDQQQQALSAAFTCAMRLGQPTRAMELLTTHADKMTSELEMLKIILETLLSQEENAAKTTKKSSLRERIATIVNTHASTALAARWMQFLYNPQQSWPDNDIEWITELAQFNVGPLDDPLLQRLDHKVELHRLLTQEGLSNNASSSSSFWPQGYVWPQEASLFAQHLQNTAAAPEEEDWWIWKRPTGYGSHGNQLVHASNVVKEAETDKDCQQHSKINYDDTRLLQKVVHPTMLLGNQQKFSLRIYVVLLPGPTVYVSRHQGLVKLASTSFSTNTIGTTAGGPMDAVFLTNSGRDTSMQQESLAYLKDSMEAQGLSYDEMWDSLTESIRHVLKRYYQAINQMVSNDTTLSHEALSWHKILSRHAAWPKIMGWDYLVDDKGDPWLLEINRFPGMEPRDEQDQSVKARVLKDAWKLAKAQLHNTSPDDSSCLEKIEL